MKINGTYGSNKTPCAVFVCDLGGLAWYAVEDSCNVNKTDSHLLVDNVDVEELPDYDCFTWSDGIDSEETLEKAVEA